MIKFNYLKLIILILIGLPYLVGLEVKSMPYDEKRAWCMDYSSNNTSLYSQTMAYDSLVNYKSCMRKGPNKIMEERRKWWKELQKKSDEATKKRIEKERKEAEAKNAAIKKEIIRLNKLKENANSLFE